MRHHELAARPLVGAPVGPWFRARPCLAIVVALALFVGAGLVGLRSADARDATIVVVVLPVALLAVTFGRRGGVGGACGVLAMLVTWQVAPGKVSGATWAGATAVVLLGQLLGSAIEGLLATEQAVRLAESRRLRAENAAQRLHEAAAVNDTMVQSVAVAKWALEAGDERRAIEVLDHAVEEGQRIVSDLLRAAGAREPGRLPAAQVIEPVPS
jgi:glucose-6-phosphate-specific signal transduction histidine kinase